MIQHFAEKTAEEVLKDNKAKAVSIVVMNLITVKFSYDK
jgi:stage V sporulation protein D (sporulation-specific penicillin-binding protein)